MTTARPLADLFPRLDEIPAAYQPDAPVEQRDYLVDAKAVRAGDWAAIESATRQALQALDSAAPAELPRDFDLRAERAEQREL